MNPLQRAVRLVGLLTLVLVALVPPWKVNLDEGGAVKTSSAGYYPLWSPPNVEVESEDEQARAIYRIDAGRLSIQLIAILLVINGAVYLLKRRPETVIPTADSPAPPV